MHRHIRCIINPAAAGGKAKYLWPKFTAALEALGLPYSTRFTERPGHATTLTRDSLQEGMTEIVAVGGDGTTHEVINGFFEKGEPVNPKAMLGIVPNGTGADFRRTLNLPKSPDDAAKVISRNLVREIDIGHLRYHTRDGEPASRYFVNVADAGYGGSLIDRVNGYTKFMGSFLAYLSGLLINLLFYRNAPIHVRVDDGEEISGRFSAIVAANGQYFGGGMWIAPEARIDDGLFEIVLIGDVNKLEVLRNLPRLYKGTLHEHPKVTYLKGRKLEIWSENEVLLDADGELPGKLPAVFEIRPGALKIFTGAGG